VGSLSKNTIPFEEELKQLGYVIQIEMIDVNMEFKTFEIAGEETLHGENESHTVYEKKRATNSWETTRDISKAQVFMSGNIKWDGCSNIVFDAQEYSALHFCGKNDLLNVGRLLHCIYDFAARNIPKADLKLM